MRALPDSLTTAQQTTYVKALAKIVLTSGSTTYTYTKTRILDIEEAEDGPLQELEITLDNRDGTLTSLDLRGYQGVLSFGATTSRGDEYDACAPMVVTSQQFNSDPKRLECTLYLVGRANLMQKDEASEAYQPDTDNTDSVKDIIDAIAGATLDCFDHCTAYTTIWEVGYDDLADTYQPKDAFRVYVSNNRLTKINQLLDYTKNVAVFKADGKLHIFKPTTSGSSYDYQYSLEDIDIPHPFFAKALRNTLVIPNYVKVESREDDTDQYSGTATDATSYALLPKSQFKQTYLSSNDQAEDIAEAILVKAQMWCEAGSASVPMNVGAEVYDYVKVTDEREDDYRVGNIGRLIRHYNLRKNEWRMTFTFGNWQNVRKVLESWNITANDIENYFSRLYVKDLYAENIYLDDVIDGPDTYQRVKSVALNASGMILLDQVVEGTYGRVKSASLSAAGLVLLDQVVEGTYGLTLATDISAGHILLSKTVKDGEWYDESGVEIDATTGINIYGANNALTTRATKTGPIQCYVGSDGAIYAGAGGVRLDIDGIHLNLATWYYGDTAYGVIATTPTGGFQISSVGGVDLLLQPNSGGDLVLYPIDKDVILRNADFLPYIDDAYDLGSAAKQFAKGYFASRLKIPVGTDMYD